jgi:hypothetical protein
VANSKQKPAPEGVKRSPGKSRFSIPRKEVPPIDGSYLDRLFADYDKQTQELEGQNDAPPATQAVESPQPPTVVEQPQPEVAESTDTGTSATTSAQITEQTSSTGPVTFPLKEITANHELESVAAIRPEVILATRTAETEARLSRQMLAAPIIEAPDGDAQLLDKWKKKHRLSKGEVKVLRVMLSMCHESGDDGCYIKISQLMQAAELRERQTQLVLRSLGELGLIEKVAEYSNLNRLGTKYRVVEDAD